MIDIIECFFQVYKNATNYFFLVKKIFNRFSKANKGMCCRMFRSKAKLFILKKFIYLKKGVHSCVNEFLKNFTENWHNLSNFT